MSRRVMKHALISQLEMSERWADEAKKEKPTEYKVGSGITKARRWTPDNGWHEVQIGFGDSKYQPEFVEMWRNKE